MKQFFITAKKKTSLLELLSEHLPSQHNPEQVIAAGGVWKERKRILNKDFILLPAETVKVHISSFQGKAYTLAPEQVVFENNDLLVVYKPCNLNVHAVPTSIHYNLTYGVNGYLEKQGTRFEANPLTRLDRPVEGLVIFAKNKHWERKLFDQIKKRKIKKWYTAALEKQGKQEHGQCLRIKDRISNNGSLTLSNPVGKEADSLFIKTETREDADIYSVFIFTGRRHQIRFHAAQYIAPIIGDVSYGSSVLLPPDEIALVCRGYNIPYGRDRLRIRLPEKYMKGFLEKVSRMSRAGI